MATEIERKFLLDTPPAQLEDRAGVSIAQGYLAIEKGVEIRLRKAGELLWLTAKRGSGRVREEVEVALEADQFEALWPLTEGRRVAKTRFRVPLEGGLCAEVDVYEGDLKGLVTAEVEFDDEAGDAAFSRLPGSASR